MQRFKNFSVFSMMKKVNMNTQLRPFMACSATGSYSDGFYPVDVEGNHDLIYEVRKDVYLMQYCYQEKIVPASVIKEQYNQTVKNIEDTQGRKVKRKTEKQTIKDDVIAELNKQAFSKYTNIFILLDNKNEYIFVSGSSKKIKVEALKCLRESLKQDDDGKVLPLENLTCVDIDSDTRFINAIKNNNLSEDITLGEKIKFKDQSGDIVTIHNKEESESILEYLTVDVMDEFKQAQLILQDEATFMLDNEYNVKAVKPLNFKFKGSPDTDKDTNELDIIELEIDLIGNIRKGLEQMLQPFEKENTQYHEEAV